MTGITMMLHIVKRSPRERFLLLISCKRDSHFLGIRCNIKTAGIVFRVFHVSDSGPEGEKVKPTTLKESATFRSILGIQIYRAV